jgi:predicted DNA-binding protein
MTQSPKITERHNIDVIEEYRRLVSLQIRLPQELIERIDKYRLSLTMRPTRSMTIRFLIENAMAILEDKRDE